MSKKKKGASRPKRSPWLFVGVLALVVAVAGIFVFARSGPAYGSLSDIGKGKPVIVEVFLPT